MPTTKRRPELGVIDSLLTEPHRFQCMQAMRVLLIWFRQNGVPYERAVQQFLRFRNSLSMSFPASEIEALSIEADDAKVSSAEALTAALTAQRLRHVRITPSFIGLLGAQGTLPFHYTERIAAHQHTEQDESTRAFFDVFSQRMVLLFFEVWGKYRLEHSLDVHGKDRFLPMLLSLGGAGQELIGGRRDGRGTGGVGEDVAAFYAGLLRQRPVSLAALRCVLPHYFGVPIAIEQFVGGWDEIDESKKCQMGGPNAMLGYSGALGMRKWRHDLRIRLHIGPLDRHDFDRFLPSASGALALEKMLALLGVAGLQYEAQLILRAADVEPAMLVAGAANGKRLGWDAFLANATPDTHKTDVRYRLHPS